jgi:hypothetical protein
VPRVVMCESQWFVVAVVGLHILRQGTAVTVATFDSSTLVSSPVWVAARSKPWVRIQLEAWMFVFVSLVLWCRVSGKRPFDGLIARPKKS